jgi:competence protein ComEC
MPDEDKKNYHKYWLLALVLLLFFANIYIFWLDWQNSHRGLTFAMLDVGQGDALFIESPTGTQVLVDGGPPRTIMKRLSRMMPFFDKKIDAIIITNPDADHIGGFADVLKVYKVGQMFEPGTFNDSKTYQNLKNQVASKKITENIARRGMQIDIGGGAVIDILFPDRDVSSWTTNDGSVVARLSYGKISVMLEGDATAETERIILEENLKEKLKSQVLKVAHHGSHTSTSPLFVEAVAPLYALISDGKNNKYGHPHEDTLSTLSAFGTEIFRTDLFGSIIMKSDGEEIEFSFKK